MDTIQQEIRVPYISPDPIAARTAANDVTPPPLPFVSPRRGAAAEGVSLLSALTEAQRKLLMSLGSVVQYRAWQTVPLQEDGRAEIFFILAGSFRVPVRALHEGTAIWTMKAFSAGDIFGELTFLANASQSHAAVATEDSWVLVLDTDAFDKLVALDPPVAAQVFRNMSSIIAGRMREALRT